MHAALAVALTTLLVASARETAAMAPAPVQITAPGTLKFDTDACGRLGQVESAGSMLIKRAADDGADEDDGDGEDEDYSWSKTWGMPDEVSSQAERWYSEHSQVAIVTDSVVRSCDDDVPEFEDSEPDGFA